MDGSKRSKSPGSGDDDTYRTGTYAKSPFDDILKERTDYEESPE